MVAANASEAEEAWVQASRTIDVVICDQMLGPDLGLDLVQRFKSDRPDINAVLCSGSTVDPAVPGISFLMKPCPPNTLLNTISSSGSGQESTGGSGSF